LYCIVAAINVIKKLIVL